MLRRADASSRRSLRTGHHHVLPIDRRPRGSSTSTVRGPRPFGMCCNPAGQGSHRFGSPLATMWSASALPDARAPFEESHASAAVPHHWGPCPPDVSTSHRSDPCSRTRWNTRRRSPSGLSIRGDDRARDRHCCRVPRALSFHGLLVPLRDQPWIRHSVRITGRAPLPRRRGWTRSVDRSPWHARELALSGTGFASRLRHTLAGDSVGRAPALRWIPPFVAR
jgi:hypothetical protein